MLVMTLPHPDLPINPETGKLKFEFVADALCLDFCNTINFGRANTNERLRTYADLVLWGELAGSLAAGQVGRLDIVRGDEALHSARSLRAVLHRIFAGIAYERSPLPADLAALNDTLSRVLPHLRIAERSDTFNFVWDADSRDADRMLWPVAHAAMELLTGPHVGYVRQCSGDGCSWLFLDQTRNHSRRWCSMEHCGNRMKMRRHYRRTRQ
jgi:predicted RNA-binding Zn ribbon-like protein